MKFGEIKTTIDKVTDWVKGQGSSQKSSKGIWGWISGMLVAGIAMLVMGLLYYRAWKQGKRLAKLLHEKDVATESKHVAKVIDFVTENEKAAAERHKIIKKANTRITRIKAELEMVEADKTRTMEKIDALKNWRDIDAFVSSDSDSNGGAA